MKQQKTKKLFLRLVKNHPIHSFHSLEQNLQPKLNYSSLTFIHLIQQKLIKRFLSPSILPLNSRILQIYSNYIINQLLNT